MKRLLAEMWLSVLLMWAIWKDRMGLEQGRGELRRTFFGWRKSMLGKNSKLFNSTNPLEHEQVTVKGEIGLLTDPTRPLPMATDVNENVTTIQHKWTWRRLNQRVDLSGSPWDRLTSKGLSTGINLTRWRKMILVLIESCEFQLDMFLIGNQRLPDKINIRRLQFPKGLSGCPCTITRSASKDTKNGPNQAQLSTWLVWFFEFHKWNKYRQIKHFLNTFRFWTLDFETISIQYRNDGEQWINSFDWSDYFWFHMKNLYVKDYRSTSD